MKVQLARSAHLRLKTLRHPNILKYIDGIEVTCFVFNILRYHPPPSLTSLPHPLTPSLTILQLPTCIYLVTEACLPLEKQLECENGRCTFSTAWGLHQTVVSAACCCCV